MQSTSARGEHGHRQAVGDAVSMAKHEGHSLGCESIKVVVVMLVVVSCVCSPLASL